ncbi:MAG: heavy metal translocating P-type ATPase metal-binding domain-containing protein [Polyangiaceae bacterium]
MASAAFNLHPQQAPAACSHCGLPVPPARMDEDSATQFCCDGCAAVHAILNSAGLAGYYGKQSPSERRAAPAPSRLRFEEFDDPRFIALHCRNVGRELSSVDLYLEGIHCSACVWLVERLSRVSPAVAEARFDMTRSVLRVTWEPERARLSEVARALDSLGYRPHAAGATDTAAEQRRGDRALLLRVGLSGAAAGNVMLMALALYSGAFGGMTAEYVSLFRWGSLLITTPAVFLAGSVFFRGALAAVRTRTPHMDLPVSIGILAGYVGSVANTLRATGEVYFDTLCTLTFLLLVGRYLQRTHHRRSTQASELLNALAPATARLVEGPATRQVPASEVSPGSVVEVEAGERIPVDGRVISGTSAIDASLLTGESQSQDITVGDRVHSGTVNCVATIRVRVESAGADTRLGRLVHAVEITQRERAPVVRLADRVAGHFVLAILAAAVLTFLVWLRIDAVHALDHTVALLVVTCPCALGMATPLAVSAALRRAAQVGILFKGGEFIEELARPGRFVFDKTGTLTEGRLDLVAWEGDLEVQPLLRSAEEHSSHPIARAIQRAFVANDRACRRVEELPGGLAAEVAGRRLQAGSLTSFVDIEVPPWAHASVERHAANGQTPIVISVDGRVAAVAAFADTLRADARRSLERLRELGFELELLSGDHPQVVQNISAQLGMPFTTVSGGATPEAKLERIRDLRAAGQRAFMVGDGVNDAAAMSAANVGIAVHGGAEVCLAAADVFTTRPGLTTVVLAALGARRTVRAIRLGIGLSLAYNAIGIGLAISGHLSPLVAAIMMPLSSITVVTLALRSKTFGGEPS